MYKKSLKCSEKKENLFFFYPLAENSTNSICGCRSFDMTERARTFCTSIFFYLKKPSFMISETFTCYQGLTEHLQIRLITETNVRWKHFVSVVLATSLSLRPSTTLSVFAYGKRDTFGVMYSPCSVFMDIWVWVISHICSILSLK